MYRFIIVGNNSLPTTNAGEGIDLIFFHIVKSMKVMDIWSF